MASKVEIVVEAKDGASGILRGITSQMGQFGSIIEQVTGSSISWGNVASAAADMVVSTLKKSIQATQEYAAEVRDLSLASGATAEESSRLLQVLDDYEISAGDVTAATKALTKNGLEPTIDTIANLADQYVQLNSAQEKNDFIIKNLGRGGLQWANALSQGGDALRELNGSIDENLILTQEQLLQAEEYRLAIDSWNDAWQAFSVTLGTSVLPFLTDVMNDIMGVNEVRAEANRLIEEGIAKNREEALSMAATSIEAQKAAEAHDLLAQASADAGNAAADSVPDYAKQLSVIQKLTDATQEQIKAVAYQQLQQQLAEGGITEEENKLLQDAGLALGIFDENAVNAAESIAYLNKQLQNGIISLQTYTALLNNIPTEITTTITTNTVGTTTSNNQFLPQQQGGEVYAGSPVMVGERGREPFMPAQDGRILGHAESLHALSMGSGGGSNYFYGNVTLQIDETMGNGILEYR